MIRWRRWLDSLFPLIGVAFFLASIVQFNQATRVAQQASHALTRMQEQRDEALRQAEVLQVLLQKEQRQCQPWTNL